MASIKAWQEAKYLLSFEIHVPQPGGPLKCALDHALAVKTPVGSWLMDGDLSQEYYTERGAHMRCVQ